jgi:hypothetical protein
MTFIYFFKLRDAIFPRCQSFLLWWLLYSVRVACVRLPLTTRNALCTNEQTKVQEYFTQMFDEPDEEDVARQQQGRRRRRRRKRQDKTKTKQSDRRVLLDDVTVELGRPHSFFLQMQQQQQQQQQQEGQKALVEAQGEVEEAKPTTTKEEVEVFASLSATVTQTVTLWRRLDPTTPMMSPDGSGTLQHSSLGQTQVQQQQPEGQTFTFAVTNLLERERPGQPFRVVHHHASQVM